MPRSDSGVGEHVTVDISEGDRYVETDPKKDKHFTKGRSGGNENARGLPRAFIFYYVFYTKFFWVLCILH